MLQFTVLMLAVVVFGSGLYIWARIQLPEWAERDKLFSSPKLGRIKARRRAGRIIRFYGNLVGKGWHVDTVTGKLVEGEQPVPVSHWWSKFGTYFIGFDDVYTYKIARGAKEDEKGNLTYDEVEASSIYFEGNYPLEAVLNTSDGLRLRVKLLLKTTTVDAAKALSLPISWTIPVFAAVLAATRDFVGARPVEMLITSQNEGGKAVIKAVHLENSGFAKLIRSLNNDKKGNISLSQVCGQRIDAVNVIDLDFADDKTRDQYNAPYAAHQVAQTEVQNAEAYATARKTRSDADAAASVAQALVIENITEAEANGMRKKVAAMGNDPKAAAPVLTAEQHAKMQNLGTLVNSDRAVPAYNISNNKIIKP